MSCDRFVAFFGLRFELDEVEIEAVGSRSDPRIVTARKAGLNHYCASFGSAGERGLLFIGRKLVVFGAENLEELSLTRAEATEQFEATETKLAAAGFSGAPKLYLHYEPDF